LNVNDLAQRLIEATTFIPSFRPSLHQKFLVALLVLKRLSDRFQEELQEVGEDDPDLFSFYVPQGARWEEIRRHSENLGDILNRATQALEDHNPPLRGLLRWADFNNRQELPPEAVERLLQSFDGLFLAKEDARDDIVGEGFIGLIDYMATLEAKETADRMTPPDLNRLLAELLAPYPRGCRIYDPASGTASSLISCGRLVEGEDFSLWGQEINLENWRLAKFNLFLHGVAGDIDHGDTLRDPAFAEGGGLRGFERIVSHPTFSLKEGDWGTEGAADDPYRRFVWCIPPKKHIESAILLHIVASLEEGGKAAAILSQGFLFRSGSEKGIRQRLVEQDFLEAVVALPEGVFYAGKAKGGARAAVVMLNKAKPEERKGKVLFVDGGREYEENPKRNRLKERNIVRLANAYRDFRDEEGLARVVDRQEIEQNDFNLSVGRYVAAAEAEAEGDPEEILDELEALRDERAKLEEAMQYLSEVLET
jgi:type I restriction enzyme M protein